MRPATAGTEDEHDANLARLEADQLAKGKQLNDQQQLATKKTEEMERLRAELERLNAWDISKEGDRDMKAA